MSKRKYKENVSEIVYGVEYKDSTMGRMTDPWKSTACKIPARIVRNSFLLRLIKCYERYGLISDQIEGK
jgi:hypothetical protein